MSTPITPRTSLETLKREAKRWLAAIRAGDAEARARLHRAVPEAPAEPTLRHVQHALAVEHGLPGWTALRERLERDAPLRQYEKVADALVTAYHAPEPSAMRAVWDYFGHMRAWEGMRRYVRLDLGRAEAPGDPDTISLDEARTLVARAQGLESWDALARQASALPPGRRVAAKPVGAFTMDAEYNPTVAHRTRDWDELLDVMRERRIPALGAFGQMTDELLERVSRLDHVTALDLNGSRALTDDGLRHLARLPDLEWLNLGGCGGITDRGLAVLRRLPRLRRLMLQWTPVTDAGAAHLAGCEALHTIDLGGTSTGDGALRALAGKASLRDVRTGRGVTDEGVSLLHEIPAFRAWQGEAAHLALLDASAQPNALLLRGRITEAGMARLVGLDGLFALNVDDRTMGVTARGLAPLAALANLAYLTVPATDESMPAIASLPHLRFLSCQDTKAGDDGFVALSRSRTLEYLWGRDTPGIGDRGFLAMSGMPAMRHLSVNLRNVSDDALAALPRFPALRELMPMGVNDASYRHIGRCERLESLVLMYCRDTGDEATSHLVGLPSLRKYFASYTRATDRTPELLSRIDSLEEVVLDSVSGLTDAGIAALARLPRLATLRVSGMPRVTPAVRSFFGPSVGVAHSVG